MADDSRAALGAAVARLRVERGLSQTQLADAAGYRKGGAVSISRFENGIQEPRPERLSDIAQALGTTTDELRALAVQSESATAAGQTELEERLSAVRQEVERRRRLASLVEAMDEAQVRAEMLFLTPFREAAGRIESAPTDDASRLSEGDDPSQRDDAAEAGYRLRLTRIGLSRALADPPPIPSPKNSSGESGYRAVAEAVSLAAAPLGSLPRLARSGAAFNAYRFLMGARPATTAGLVGAVALGVALGVAAAERSDAVRRARRDQEMAEKIAAAEAELDATAELVKVLEEAVPEATELLEYVAVHAAHALTRWVSALPEGPVRWESLDSDQQRKYDDFVAIASAQLAVVKVGLDELDKLRGAEFEQAAAVALHVLRQAKEQITSLV